MKWFSALIVSLAMLGVVQAAGPDDQYIEIYNLIQQADGLKGADSRQALEKYTQAQTGLKKMQSSYPSWNADIVKFRLDYVAEKLVEVSKKVSQAPGTAASITAPKKVTSADLQQQIADLAEQVQSLAADKLNLEKRLKEALSVQPASTDPRELEKAEQEIASLRKEKDLLSLTLDQAKAGQSEASSKHVNRSDAKQVGKLQDALQNAEKANLKLENEIAQLQKKLKEKESKKSARGKAADAGLVEQLRQRIAVLEANPVPYTAEELAIIQKAPIKPEVIAAAPADTVSSSTSAPAKKGVRSVKDLPPGAGALMADAQRSFLAGEYEVAEKKYGEVLRQDDKNVYVLSHLASAQFFANHSEDCEKSVKLALSLDPDDAFSLYTLGNLRLRQNNYDDAMNLLSRSASINPTNSAVQNSLGLALSQKGLNKPAEAALRKALQLDPSFPQAHQNLAVVYATQKPPFIELARWHYKKSIDLGQPRHPELEKVLEAAAAPAATPATPAPEPATPAPAAAPQTQ